VADGDSEAVTGVQDGLGGVDFDIEGFAVGERLCEVGGQRMERKEQFAVQVLAAWVDPVR